MKIYKMVFVERCGDYGGYEKENLLECNSYNDILDNHFLWDIRVSGYHIKGFW